MRGNAALTLALWAGLGVGGCSARQDPLRWIDASAATIQCTTAGRTRMPPVLLGLPTVAVPSGLYARRLDPMALGDMGYARDRPVCAAMLGHDDAAIERASVELPALASLIRRTSDAAMRSMACPCEVADALGARHLVVACAQTPARRCEDSQRVRDEMSAILSPLIVALQTSAVPRVHWRLVGPTDRPEWFAERLTQLLPRHPGGSTLFFPGQAVPARANHRLIASLLEQPGVVAVVRQDSGKALLVARVLEGMQILDHFALPALGGELAAIRDDLDNAATESVVAALARPSVPTKLGLSPKDGNLIELDVAALERHDAMLVAASVLASKPYALADEVRQEPAPLVDRVTVQAPFGQQGHTLVVRAALSAAGRQWALALPDARLGASVDALALRAAELRFVPAVTPAPKFALRGTPTNRVVVHGLSKIPAVMRAMELFRPGAVEGTTFAWDFQVPQSSLAHGGALVAPDALRGLADLVMERDYRVTAAVDADAGVITGTFAPE